jgi:hypothetical protein
MEEGEEVRVAELEPQPPLIELRERDKGPNSLHG